METGTAREVGVHCHEHPAVALQHRVAIGKQAEHLAGPVPHGNRVVRQIEAIFDGPLDVTWMGEQIEVACLADGDVGRQRQPILASPWVDRPEQRPVHIEYVLVADP